MSDSLGGSRHISDRVAALVAGAALLAWRRAAPCALSRARRMMRGVVVRTAPGVFTLCGDQCECAETKKCLAPMRTGKPKRVLLLCRMLASVFKDASTGSGFWQGALYM